MKFAGLRSLIVLATALGAVFAFAGLVGPSQSARAANASVSAGATTNRFTPNSVTVNVGDTVTFTQVGGVHTATSVPGGFDISLQTTGATGSKTFPTAGTFYYYCSVHSDAGSATEANVVAASAMVGKVVVQAAAATATSVPATATSVPATATSVPATAVPATATAVPATVTPAAATATAVPATATPSTAAATATPTRTPIPPTTVPPTSTPPPPPTATPTRPAIAPAPPAAGSGLATGSDDSTRLLFAGFFVVLLGVELMGFGIYRRRSTVK